MFPNGAVSFTPTATSLYMRVFHSVDRQIRSGSCFTYVETITISTFYFIAHHVCFYRSGDFRVEHIIGIVFAVAGHC